jgi:hypothetical protein
MDERPPGLPRAPWPLIEICESSLLRELSAGVVRGVHSRLFPEEYVARVWVSIDAGPLAGWVHPFREELIGQGFTARTAQDNAYVLAHFSR